MSTRKMAWSFGLLVMLALVIPLAREVRWSGLVVPLALLGLGLSALVGELGSILVAKRQPAGVAVLADGRSADGIVEIITMLGVDAESNSREPRYRRFLQMIEDPGGSSRAPQTPKSQPIMLGRVALISVFVGRDGAGWSDDEIARGHDALEKAGSWIEREAIRLALPLNFALADTYFVVQDDAIDNVEVAFMEEGDDVGPMEADALTKAVAAASRAAAASGFLDVADWIARVEPRLEADARAWLFHVRCSGRSLAIPANESGVPGVALAVCYSREASFPGAIEGSARVDPTTVVHELFHLFGASDKYGVSLRSFPAGSVGSRDIMRLEHDRLARMRVDPLTAAEIGWGSLRSSGGSTKKTRRRASKADDGRERGRSD